MQSREPEQQYERRPKDGRPIHMTVRIGQIPNEDDPQTADKHPQAAKDGIPEGAAARGHGGEDDQGEQPEPVHRDLVGEALACLLSKRQIEFIRSQTFLGPSREQILRQLVTLGISAWGDRGR